MTFSLKLDSLSQKIEKYSNPTMNQKIIGVYVGCNETETERVKTILLAYRQLPNSCHIGFSGWHNFDLMVQRNSGRGILCDFNPEERNFLVISLMATQIFENRYPYAAFIKNYVIMNLTKFSPNIKDDNCIGPDDEIELELTRKGSWLSTDPGYLYIKNLAASGKICIITEDIRNDVIFEKISRKLKKNNLSIDTLYVSNIPEYMCSPEDKRHYINTIKHLFTYETKLIHCSDGLCQVVSHGCIGSMLTGALSKPMIEEVHEDREEDFRKPVIEELDEEQKETVYASNSMNSPTGRVGVFRNDDGIP